MKSALKWTERRDKEDVKKGKGKWKQAGKRERYYKKVLPNNVEDYTCFAIK